MSRWSGACKYVRVGHAEPVIELDSALLPSILRCPSVQNLLPRLLHRGTVLRARLALGVYDKTEASATRSCMLSDSSAQLPPITGAAVHWSRAVCVQLPDNAKYCILQITQSALHWRHLGGMQPCSQRAPVPLQQT